MRALRTERGHFLMGFAATLGFALAAALIYATYLMYVKEPQAAPPSPPARTRASPSTPPKPLISQTQLDATDRKTILASQSDLKRNQILIVDAYLQLLGRYPNAREQAAWLPLESVGGKALMEMRKIGQGDEVIARYIAGQLLESTALVRFPAIKKATLRGLRLGSGSDDAAVIAAILARGLGADEGLRDDASLVRQLQREFGLVEGGATPLTALTAMLRDLAATSDVTEHFIEEGTPLEVEVEAIRTVLKEGRLVVISGADTPTHGRLVLAVGFDGQGNFLVRDPEGRMPERVSAAVIKAFLLRPGLRGAEGTPGLWVELPARRGRCRPNIRLAGLPTGLDGLVMASGEDGLTGVIPGAQVNLTALRTPAGEHSIKGTLSLTAEQIDRILEAGKSPAAGSGESFVRWGRYYNIDPAWALAFFKHESWYGAHPKWVGQMGGGKTSRNIGNIRYRGRPNPQRVPQYTEFNGFRAYATWDDGIHDYFKLLAQDSNYAGLHTVERILPIYAPSFENDTQRYIRDVIAQVTQWRTENRVALATQQVQPAVAVAAAADPGCADSGG